MDKPSNPELTYSLSPEAREVMLDLILSWARYDGLISQWLLLAYGLSLDSGSILLGNMDTRTKLERIKGLYQHHGMTSAVAKIAKLQKTHLSLVDIRNLIAHSGCGGHHKDRPWLIAFAPVRTEKGHIGKMLLDSVSITKMHAAERFAREAASVLFDFTQALEFQALKPPPEPPEFPQEIRPNPQMRS